MAPAAAPAARIACRTVDELAGATAAWDALAACAIEPNPFLESWYLLPALRALDTAGETTVLTLEVDGLLAGLLPLVRQRRYYRWPVPNAATWLHGNCFLGAPLIAAGFERLFWRCLLAWMDENAGSSLFLHLPELPLDGPAHAALRAELDQQGRFAALVKRDERAMLASDQTPQDYFEASLTGKKRKELRRQFARLSELGEVVHERQRDGAGLDRWTDEFLLLEAAGWKGAAGSALAADPATARLLREALAGAARRGRLERLTLRLDGAPIAMLATFLTPPGAFSFKTAFDENYARFSPGVLLQRENLDILADPAVAWTDSCASAGHPMIDHIWRERRPIGRLSIAIGGRLRRAAFRRLAQAELARGGNPAG